MTHRERADRRQRIRDDCANTGMSLKEVVKKYGVTYGYASSITKGLTNRCEPVRKDARNAAIMQGRKEGKSLLTLAKEHGISRERVRQIQEYYR
jgi:Mor family transcriptional regulator